MNMKYVSRETFSWRWITDCGLQVSAGESTLPLYNQLKKARLEEIAELVPADGSLLLVLKPGAVVTPKLRNLLNGEHSSQSLASPGRQHEIEVVFNGIDLPQVAEKLGLTIQDLTSSLCKIDFLVKFLGFQPGFAYLTGLPETWHLPRLDNPRKKVPAGSVAMAGPYCGVYPAESPGGWHLLGQTQTRVFDPNSLPPALFQPGDTVRLVAA